MGPDSGSGLPLMFLNNFCFLRLEFQPEDEEPHSLRECSGKRLLRKSKSLSRSTAGKRNEFGVHGGTAVKKPSQHSGHRSRGERGRGGAHQAKASGQHHTMISSAKGSGSTSKHKQIPLSPRPSVQHSHRSILHTQRRQVF